MGMGINIYTKELSAEFIPEIKKRFADFHMDIEFHPEFKFNEQTDTGFLPIKLKVHPGQSKHYDSIGHDIMTGFELAYSSFDFDEELKSIQQYAMPAENKSFFSKLIGGGGKAAPKTAIDVIADKELDQLLKPCKKTIILNFKSRNKSELRISLFFAAILAELTRGIIYDPQNGRYLSGPQALETFPLEISDYEQSFSPEEFTVDKFEGWI